MQTFVSTSRVFNYFSKTVHSEWIIKDNPARALKHNTPVHVSSKHNGLRLADCVKRWRTDGNIKTGLPAVSKSQWEEGSLEADCHIYTGSWQRKKKKNVNYKQGSAAVCESCRSARTWQIREHWRSPLTQTCVSGGDEQQEERFHAVWTRGINVTLVVVLGREEGRQGWLTQGWLTHARRRYADDVVLWTESWNWADKATGYRISSWCCAATAELYPFRTVDGKTSPGTTVKNDFHDSVRVKSFGWDLTKKVPGADLSRWWKRPHTVVQAIEDIAHLFNSVQASIATEIVGNVVLVSIVDILVVCHRTRRTGLAWVGHSAPKVQILLVLAENKS